MEVRHDRKRSSIGTHSERDRTARDPGCCQCVRSCSGRGCRRRWRARRPRCRRRSDDRAFDRALDWLSHHELARADQSPKTNANCIPVSFQTSIIDAPCGRRGTGRGTFRLASPVGRAIALLSTRRKATRRIGTASSGQGRRGSQARGDHDVGADSIPERRALRHRGAATNSTMPSSMKHRLRARNVSSKQFELAASRPWISLPSEPK